MPDEINAFGTIVGRGYHVRVAFDRNMGLVRSESGAAFVLEFTLGADGHVYLRQAGASAEEGLVLTTVRQKSDVKIGRIVDLSNLLRLQHGEICHPSRAGKLSFMHKGYAGKTVLELNWEAGAMPVSPGCPDHQHPGGPFGLPSGARFRQDCCFCHTGAAFRRTLVPRVCDARGSSGILPLRGWICSPCRS